MVVEGVIEDFNVVDIVSGFCLIGMCNEFLFDDRVLECFLVEG